MDKSIVSIVKGPDLGKMVEEVVSLLGGINILIKPTSTVVVKPNDHKSSENIGYGEAGVHTNRREPGGGQQLHTNLAGYRVPYGGNGQY